MKKFTVLMFVLSSWDIGYAFEDEKLNNLYDKLQDHINLKEQTHNRLATIVYFVGNDGACQYSLIKEAINAANNNGDSNNYEIRVAYNKIYTENLLINRTNLTLKGGYANCVDAINNVEDGNKTELDASTNALPAIIMRNLTSNNQHNNNVYNFDISGGTHITSSLSGGINIRDNNIEVHIENSFIHDNNGISGGGIYVEGDASVLFLKDSIVLLNDATNGGGLYCDAATVYVYGDSGVALNNAIGNFPNGNGGGVYLTNACNFNLFSGTSGGFFDFRGIAGNTANRDGGGIFANAGSQIILMGYLFIGDFGNNDQPVNITANKANVGEGVGAGGGINAEDDGTNISAYATIINNNETTEGFGSSAAAVNISQADFSIGKLDSTCWSTFKCNQISDNKVFGEISSDAGIRATSGANIKIKNTWISGHSSSANVFFFGQSISAVIEGNIFTGNGGPSVDGNTSLLFFHNDADGIIVAYNTFVNNEINTSMFRTSFSPNMLVHANIIKENNNVDILQLPSGSSGANLQFNCLIVHENQSFTGSSILVADPDFVDEANEDFHLNSASPAIDLCADSLYVATTKDVDNEYRGWDDFITSNTDGPYDAGFDEFYPLTDADLSVDKILLSEGPFFARQNVNYQITVTNNGPDDAINTHVEDTPLGMFVNSVQSTHCSSFPCVIDNLNIGSSEVIQVQAKLHSSGGDFDNSVFVYSEGFDANISNNTDDSGNAGIAIMDQADIDIAVFDLITKPPYHSGQVLTYHVGITNNGPDSARNVVIAKHNNSVNSQVLNITGKPCVQLPCNITSFAAGVTINLIISVKIVHGGSFDFSLIVSTASTDTNPDNDTGDVLDLHASNTSDLTITSELMTAPDYFENDAVEFEIIVKNNGPELSSAIISNNYNNLEYISVSGAGCDELPCNVGVLLNSDTKTISVMARIIDSGVFSLDTNASLVFNYDPDLNNNDSSVGSTALMETDLIFENSFE